MHYKTTAVLITLALGGCVSTSNVLEVVNSGAEKCNSLGKKFMFLNENTAKTRMDIDTTVTIYFRCLNENDSEYTRPGIEKSPDLVIEER